SRDRPPALTTHGAPVLPPPPPAASVTRTTRATNASTERHDVRSRRRPAMRTPPIRPTAGGSRSLTSTCPVNGHTRSPYAGDPCQLPTRRLGPLLSRRSTEQDSRTWPLSAQSVTSASP